MLFDQDLESIGRDVPARCLFSLALIHYRLSRLPSRLRLRPNRADELSQSTACHVQSVLLILLLCVCQVLVFKHLVGGQTTLGVLHEDTEEEALGRERQILIAVDVILANLFKEFFIVLSLEREPAIQESEVQHA